MDLHVLGNITLCFETLPTIITLELPQASMSKGVSIEIRNGSKSSTTFITLIIPNTIVCQGCVW
ncbi:hypothetical protein E2C01_035249 [Portunus trituberculatus]|uniref:Uncharacterized protein n=1 Tax=Portunus trituberculatus TaxID=210409 RepID=A0A5B7F8V2_PORTR|nr:hypothetical protein [Portunus trituberculatus]